MNIPLANPDLKAIEAKLGRPLRVLHIGNIANNAYYNAMIQRRHGIEADVICYDYYHVMSCPEWEDASFEGDIDPNFPNWWGTNLKGWQRPRWFAQGPAIGCIQYQHARALGLKRLAGLLWTYIEARSLGVVRYMAQHEGRSIPPLPWRFIVAIMVVKALGLATIDPPDEQMPVAAEPGDGSGATADTDYRNNGSIGAEKPAMANVSSPKLPLHPNSRIRNLLRPVVRAGVQAIWLAVRSATSMLRVMKRMLWWLPGKARTLAAQAVSWTLALPYRNEAGKLKAAQPLEALAERDAAFLQRLAVLRHHCEGLPDAERKRVEAFAFEHPRQFFTALCDYDVIQGYAIDGFIPYMNGLSRFISYEHGTLRELPFESSFYGAVTRTAFLYAPVVFVTNSDVMPSTVRMGLQPERIVCLPHPFHEGRIDRFLADNPNIRPPDGPAVFFSPTRHHWIDTSGSWTKGNDVFLRAAGRIAAEGLDFRITLVEWGKEVAASKALIAELGFSDKVTWVGTMQKHELWEAYARAHAVVDQFTLPALGAVGVEVMALGRRLITAIDEEQLARFFGEAPPALSAQTIDECVAQMRSVILDRDDEAGRGAAVRRWIKSYHSSERILALQARAYRHLISKETALKCVESPEK